MDDDLARLERQFLFRVFDLFSRRIRLLPASGELKRVTKFLGALNDFWGVASASDYLPALFKLKIIRLVGA